MTKRLLASAVMGVWLTLSTFSLAGAETQPEDPESASDGPMSGGEPAYAPMAPIAHARRPSTQATPTAVGNVSAQATAQSNLKLNTGQTADVVRISVILTLMALLPAIAICMTPFVRLVVVLSMLRHAFGMPETPPNQVLVSLALFLTIFIMAPTLSAVNTAALQPFLSDAITVPTALERASDPLRVFMLRQVHDQDLKTVYGISKKPLPSNASQVGLMELTTAFMLNELRVSFKIGFVVMLPFLLIDLVVSSILLALGMMMVPPSTLSLPLKVLMFVLIDGWSLVLQGVAGSFR